MWIYHIFKNHAPLYQCRGIYVFTAWYLGKNGHFKGSDLKNHAPKYHVQDMGIFPARFEHKI